LVDGLVCIVELFESGIEFVTLIGFRSRNAILSRRNQFARGGNLFRWRDQQ
jgi:hypothetical protein